MLATIADFRKYFIPIGAGRTLATFIPVNEVGYDKLHTYDVDCDALQVIYNSEGIENIFLLTSVDNTFSTEYKTITYSGRGNLSTSDYLSLVRLFTKK